MEQQVDELNELIITERNEQINEIETNMVIIAEINRSLATQTCNQADELDRIDALIGETADNVEAANQQLQQAAVKSDYKRKLWAAAALVGSTAIGIISFSIFATRRPPVQQ